MNILSIQSHVAFGYVGNAAATLPLQRLGCEVWPVHTVMFSNHTGYGRWQGPVLPAADVKAVIAGLADLDLLAGCDAVLSGYLGDKAIGEVVLDTVGQARAANPRAIYCCDPVMGDVDTGLYVRPDIPDFMRTEAVPAADIVTPNQFELAMLTDMPTGTLTESVAAAAAVRAMGPQVVVVTSLNRSDGPAGVMEMVVLSEAGTWLVGTPKVPLPLDPSGAGDAVAAMFTALYLRHGDVVPALEGAASAIFAIVDATARAATRELQIVAAQDEIATPSRTFRAERLG